MKVVIFAGGFGTRISEESHLKPKPMVEIGGKPILWHIMKIYQFYGFNEFVICLGYKGYQIKEYFANYYYHNSDLEIDLQHNKIEIAKPPEESFKVTLVDTGLETKTAGRLKRIKPYIDDTFMLTYGDGVADIDIAELVNFHKSHNKIATVTAYQPTGKFGIMDLSDNDVTSFSEKPMFDNVWINAGFFVLDPKVFDYLSDESDDIMWEQDPLRDLVSDDELKAFRHNGFWKCMDILKDKMELEEMWKSNPAWRNW